MGDSAFLLDRISALMQAAVRDDAARHGLLPVHLQVLSYLDHANRYSDIPTAVAEYLGITRGTVSQSIGVLERDGYVVKVRDETHGRLVHLELTELGREVVGSSWARRVAEAFDSVDAEAMQVALVSMLRSLQANNGQSAFGVCHTCAHFRRNGRRALCGLTLDPLESRQTQKICREWTSPDAA